MARGKLQAPLFPVLFTLTLGAQEAAALTGTALENCERLATVNQWKGVFTLTGKSSGSRTLQIDTRSSADQTWNYQSSLTVEVSLANDVITYVPGVCNYLTQDNVWLPATVHTSTGSGSASLVSHHHTPSDNFTVSESWEPSSSNPLDANASGAMVSFSKNTMVIEYQALPDIALPNVYTLVDTGGTTTYDDILFRLGPEDSVTSITVALPGASATSLAIQTSRKHTSTVNFFPAGGIGDGIPGEWTETWDLQPCTPNCPVPPPKVVEDPCLSSGSIIGCETQSLGEAVAIAGTPYTLYYQSSRMAGTTGANTVATAWAKATGGWTPNVWHRYDPASKTLFLGTGAFRGPDSLGTLKRTAASGYLIPAEDGSVVYEFNSTGVHLKTRHALTGATLLAFARDASGRLTKITDASGNITKFTRNGSGLLTGIVSPYGLTSTVTLNANGFMTGLTLPNAQTVKATYTTKGLMTSFTNSRGKVSYFTYEASGLLTQDKDAAGGIQKLAKAGGTVTHTSQKGLLTTYDTVFTANGVDRVVTEPSGLTRTLNQSALGDTVVTANGMQIASTTAADPRFGQGAGYPETYRTTTPGGLVRNLATTRVATLANSSDPFSLTAQMETLSLNGKVFTSEFDTATLTFTGTSPLGRITTTEVDSLGRPVSTTLAGLNSVDYTYDTRGRLAEISVGTTTPRTRLLEYNADGYLSQITNALGQAHSLSRDKLGRVLQQTREDGSQVQFAYDANGNPTQVTNPAGGVTLFTYSNTDLPASITLPEVNGIAPKHLYAYNLDRQLTKHTFPDGSFITYGYDASGRPNKATSGTDIWTYSYDASDGYLKNLDAPGGIGVALLRDGDLLTGLSWTGPVTGQVGLAYNASFKLKSVKVNGLNAIAYTYDADGLMTKAGALTISRKPNNGLRTGSTLGGVKDTLTYNTFGEVTKYQATYKGTPLLTRSYVYDKLGRVTKITESVQGAANKVSSYQYDALGQLISATVAGTTRTYEYDANGNRTSFASSSSTGQTGIYDAQDKLLSYGTTDYSYSGNGEVISQRLGNQTIHYEYNARGDLTGVVLASGDRIDYLVDAMGLRVGKKVNGMLDQAFLYQGSLKPAVELDGTGKVVSRFVYGSRFNVPEYMVRGGATYRILTDHLGSPRLVVNTSTGNVAQRLSYDEFGNVVEDSRPGFQPFGFAGGLYDPDTQLVHYGKREFDPRLGRFTTQDPVLFSGGITNAYANLNDPVNTIDPDGREWTWSDNPVTNFIKGKFKSVKIGPVEFATDKAEASIGASQTIMADDTEIISVEAEVAMSIDEADRSVPDQFSWRAKVGAKIPALAKLPLVGKYFCTEAETSGKVHVFDDASREVFSGGQGTNLGRANSLLYDSSN